MILLCSPKSCCCRAVFSPFKAVICCWILLFSAFWKLKCLFISSSILTNSFDRLFFTSAVFIVSTDSKVSFSDLNICTSFLWLLSSLEMLFICCWIIIKTYFKILKFSLQWSRVGSEALGSIVEVISGVLHCETLVKVILSILFQYFSKFIFHNHFLITLYFGLGNYKIGRDLN